LRLAVLRLQALLLGLRQAAVLANQPMSLDGAGHGPNQRAGRRRVDADVGVAAGLIGQRGQLLFTLFAQQDQGVVGAAAAQRFGQVEGVQQAGLVAH
jgi:hypothetical protein